jgi:hypothetical protein
MDFVFSMNYLRNVFQVVHPLRQPNVAPKCPTKNNEACMGLCLLTPEGGYECACPDNHMLASDSRSCLSQCDTEEFACTKNLKCISKLWQCDGEDDCGDSSDEQGCPDRNCPVGEYSSPKFKISAFLLPILSVLYYSKCIQYILSASIQFLDVNCSPRGIGKERWPASPLINTEISNHVTILKLTCARK